MPLARQAEPRISAGSAKSGTRIRRASSVAHSELPALGHGRAEGGERRLL